MLRRLLLIVSLLALVMAVASPALADDKDKDKGNKHTPTATTTTTATPTATGTVVAAASATATKAAINGRAFQAVVVSVSGTNLFVKSDKFNANLTVSTDGNTVIHWPKGIVKQTAGTEPALKDFMAGDRVVVKLAERPTDLTKSLPARAIYLVPGQTFVHVTGTVTEAASGSLKVQRAEGVVTFTVGTGVQVRTGHETAAYDASKLPAGTKVTVVARGSLTSGQALNAFSIAVHGQNNGKADADKEKDNPGVGQGKGQTGGDQDQNENEDADSGQSHGKALGKNKGNPGKP